MNMRINMTRQQAEKMRQVTREVLFPEPEDGKKIMCATFPSNGLYVAEGVARTVIEKNTEIADMTEYFREMKLGNYYDLKATLAFAEESPRKGEE